ncbi:nonstructural protein [Microviridae sp.]|nr:nonstructural protein [Microviridae sp.]
MKPLYSIYDQIAGFYSPVFLAENDAHATRMFSQSIDLNHKKDFSLWCLGNFDADTGFIKTHKAPELVSQGLKLEEPQQ